MNINILKSFVSGEFVDDNVSFIGKLESGTLGKELKFPLSESDCLEHLLPLSSKAYFGKNDKSVLDPEYRKAQVIYPNSFFCNFDPNNYDIIDKIQTSMGESVNNIKFVRDKLNIYSTEGHFKVHKDTPRSPDMIGTLVICFPSAFTGGDLVLHTDPHAVFQFDKLSATHFQWAAFYGDIDHEVKPVESGHRITITYLINKTKNIAEPNIQFVNSVKNILKNPDILPEGGFLGYGCKYLYSSGSDSAIFKGEDSVVFASFHSLGIKPIVENITYYMEVEGWRGHICDWCKKSSDGKLEFVNRHFDSDLDICLDCSRSAKGWKIIKEWNVGSAFYTAPPKCEYVEADDVRDMLNRCGKRLVRDIYWMNSPYGGESKLAIESDILYGNEPTTNEEVYKRCVFLIYINSYKERKIGLYQPETIPSHTTEHDVEAPPEFSGLNPRMFNIFEGATLDEYEDEDDEDEDDGDED